MKLNQILGTETHKFNNEIEKREFAMKGIEKLIELNRREEDRMFSGQFGRGIKLNLGCGNRKLKDFINIDGRVNVNPDIVHDLEYGLPNQIEDNSVTGIYASNIFEHIRRFIPLMEDIYRSCKNGAVVVAIVPHYKSHFAYDDPTHVRLFSEYTFQYFSKEFEKRNADKFDYSFNCDFRIIDTVIDENGIMSVTMEVIKDAKGE